MDFWRVCTCNQCEKLLKLLRAYILIRYVMILLSEFRFDATIRKSRFFRKFLRVFDVPNWRPRALVWFIMILDFISNFQYVCKFNYTQSVGNCCIKSIPKSLISSISGKFRSMRETFITLHRYIMILLLPLRFNASIK